MSVILRYTDWIVRSLAKCVLPRPFFPVIFWCASHGTRQSPQVNMIVLVEISQWLEVKHVAL